MLSLTGWRMRICQKKPNMKVLVWAANKEDKYTLDFYYSAVGKTERVFHYML
jgi:hypothetical protein